MRLKVLACKVMARELYRIAGQSENVIDIQWLRQALHEEPKNLQLSLQRHIDRTEENLSDEPFDAILLGYGLCSNGIAGLTARSLPLVIPRAHDCITLLLGSRQRYQNLFDEGNGGVYWYSNGWCAHSLMPGKERYERVFREYAEKYGEDNAQYLMEMEQNWMREYNKAIYIRWPGINDDRYLQESREGAAFLNWAFQEEKGSDALLHSFLNGPWEQEDFLVVPPGKRVQATYDHRIIDV